MPDISMCKNLKCEFRKTCYRFRATPNNYRQAYGDFKPLDGKCDYYYKIEKQQEIYIFK